MVDYGKLSDIELVCLLTKSDSSAYAEIYNRYWAVLYRHAMRMLRDEEMAEDTIQDVFLNLWEKTSIINLRSTLSSYLYAAVRNKILDYWCHKRVKEKYISAFGKFIEKGECETDFLVREKDFRQLIETEIAALPENLRRAFELSRNSNMTYQEIAQELGVSEHVVRNNLSRALKVLRTRFGDLAVICFIFNNW